LVAVEGAAVNVSWVVRALALWHVEVAQLLTVVVYLGSGIVIKVYATLWNNFTYYRFILAHHLIWITVHYSVS